MTTDHTTGPAGGQPGGADSIEPDPTNVRYLPAVRADESDAIERRESGAIEHAGPILDAEIVTPAEYNALQKQRALERYRGYRHDVQVAAAFTKRVVTHETTKTAGRAVLRNVLYLPAGAKVVAKRARDARTNSRYERLMDTAEATGKWDQLLELEHRSEQAKQRRHDREMEQGEKAKQAARAWLIRLGMAFGSLLGIGVLLALATENVSRVLDPIRGVLDVVAWLAVAVTIVWPFLLVGPPVVAVGYLWQVGRRHGETPRWAASPSARVEHDDVPITPSIVVTALRDLGISELRKAIVKMGDAGAAMLGPITIAGCGVEVDVTLPSGVTTDEVQRKRRRLAENLSRHEHELFITIPQAARTVRLWIADSGALDQPIGPSPLVTDPDMTADVYTGKAPWGQDLRGEKVALPLLMRHLLITGLSNQGKTAALRALVLWLVLDPTVEVKIADLKGVGDWRMFDQLATTLIQGPTDDHVIAATEMLEDGVREMHRRITAVKATGATDGITREMARSEQGFHPMFLVVDEAQVAFMCPAKDEDGNPFGGTKATSRYFMATRHLHNQGRAVNIHLWQGTQDPTDQNLPKLVREGAHIRAALVLGTEQQARMALGDKAVNGGAAPHKLRQGLDKGTLVVAGDGVPLQPGQASLTLRTNFLNGEDAADVTRRALQHRATVHAEVVEEQRDMVADVAAVLHGQDAVKAVDVAARLRHLAPGYHPYRNLSAQALADLLGDAGVPVRFRDGVLTVRSDRVRSALAQRTVTDPVAE